MSNPQSVVLEENIDPNWEPSQEEIDEYAKWLGMDMVADADLVWVAREGLKAPLPDHWKPCKTDDGDIYYFNFESGESVWDHPCDEYYRNLYKEEKKRKTSNAEMQEEKKKEKKERKKKEKEEKEKAKIEKEREKSLSSVGVALSSELKPVQRTRKGADGGPPMGTAMLPVKTAVPAGPLSSLSATPAFGAPLPTASLPRMTSEESLGGEAGSDGGIYAPSSLGGSNTGVGGAGGDDKEMSGTAKKKRVSSASKRLGDAESMAAKLASVEDDQEAEFVLAKTRIENETKERLKKWRVQLEEDAKNELDQCEEDIATRTDRMKTKLESEFNTQKELLQRQMKEKMEKDLETWKMENSVKFARLQDEAESEASAALHALKKEKEAFLLKSKYDLEAAKEVWKQEQMTADKESREAFVVELASARDTWKQEFKAQHAQDAEASDRVQQQADQIAALEKTILELKETIQGQQEALQNAAQEKKALEAALQDAQSQQANAPTTTVPEAVVDTESQEKLRAALQEMDALKAADHSKSGEIQSLGAQLKAAQAELVTLANKNSVLEQSQAEWKESKTKDALAQGAVVTRLEDELAVTKTELSRLSRTLELTTAEAVPDRSAEVSQLQQDVSHWRQKYEVTTASLTVAETSLHKQQAATDAALQTLRDERDALIAAQKNKQEGEVSEAVSRHKQTLSALESEHAAAMAAARQRIAAEVSEIAEKEKELKLSQQKLQAQQDEFACNETKFLEGLSEEFAAKKNEYTQKNRQMETQIRQLEKEQYLQENQLKERMEVLAEKRKSVDKEEAQMQAAEAEYAQKLKDMNLKLERLREDETNTANMRRGLSEERARLQQSERDLDTRKQSLVSPLTSNPEAPRVSTGTKPVEAVDEAIFSDDEDLRMDIRTADDLEQRVKVERKRLARARKFLQSHRADIRRRQKALEQSRNEWKDDMLRAEGDSEQREILREVKRVLDTQAELLNQEVVQAKNTQKWLELKATRTGLMEKQLETSRQTLDLTQQRERDDSSSSLGGETDLQVQQYETLLQSIAVIEEDLAKVSRALRQQAPLPSGAPGISTHSPRQGGYRSSELGTSGKENHNMQMMHLSRHVVYSEKERMDEKRRGLRPMGSAQRESWYPFPSDRNMPQGTSGMQLLKKWGEKSGLTSGSMPSTTTRQKLMDFQLQLNRWSGERDTAREMLQSHSDWLRAFQRKMHPPKSLQSEGVTSHHENNHSDLVIPMEGGKEIAIQVRNAW
jgi:centrosomal protein CEP164